MAQHSEQWQWQAPGAAWKGVGLYHVTLTVTDHQPLLGTLVIPGDDPAQARVESLPLGRAVLDCLRQVPARHPEIQVLHYCLMPDHLHAVWYVTRHMPKGILTAVRGFWQGAKKAARDLSAPSATPHPFLPLPRIAFGPPLPLFLPLRRILSGTIPKKVPSPGCPTSAPWDSAANSLLPSVTSI